MTDLVSSAPQNVHRRANVDWDYLLNVVLAILLILLLAPLLVLLAVLVKLGDGGPVMFKQARLGRGGRTFPCLKFRSMAVDAEERLHQLLALDSEAGAEWATHHKLRNDPRITRVGAFLRTSSLDELPQLFNVLTGDMGLVGPRPVVREEALRYGRRLNDYCSVRPGITGLWQVSGRSNTSYRRRVALDVLYSRSKSISLDIWILLATVPAVLLRKGAF